MAARPDTPVVPLREAATILGVSIEAARSTLRHHGIRSGYPLAVVEWLRDNRPGRGARTDLEETRMNLAPGQWDAPADPPAEIYEPLIEAGIDADAITLDPTGETTHVQTTDGHIAIGEDDGWWTAYLHADDGEGSEIAEGSLERVLKAVIAAAKPRQV